MNSHIQTLDILLYQSVYRLQGVREQLVERSRQ